MRWSPGCSGAGVVKLNACRDDPGIEEKEEVVYILTIYFRNGVEDAQMFEKQNCHIKKLLM